VKWLKFSSNPLHPYLQMYWQNRLPQTPNNTKPGNSIWLESLIISHVQFQCFLEAFSRQCVFPTVAKGHRAKILQKPLSTAMLCIVAGIKNLKPVLVKHNCYKFHPNLLFLWFLPYLKMLFSQLWCYEKATIESRRHDFLWSRLSRLAASPKYPHSTDK
jgi:hypothetical protein